MNKSFAYVNLVIVLIAAVLLGLLFMFNIPDGNVGSRNLSVSDNWKYNGGASGNVRQDEDADPEKPVFDPVNTISMSRQIDRSTFKGTFRSELIRSRNSAACLCKLVRLSERPILIPAAASVTKSAARPRLSRYSAK